MSITMLALSRIARARRADSVAAARKRGIGHFAAIALSAAAAVGFFAILYPVAKNMMESTVTSMQTVQQWVLNNTICASGNCTA